MESSKNAVYDLQYHLVLVTKYRYKVLNGEIRDLLTSIIYDIADIHHIEVISLAIQPEHVHIMFNAKPTTYLPSLVRDLKSISSKQLFKQFGDVLHKKYWKRTLWNPSYCICTVSERSTQIVKRYIEAQ